MNQEPSGRVDGARSAGIGASLVAESLAVTYEGRDGTQTPAVTELDLVVERGEVFCIVGPSGCGKTTFLNAVAGFVPVTAGDLTLDGARIAGPGPDRAMVFQQPSLLPWRTALANVTYGLEFARGWTRAHRREHAMHLLELVRLADAADRYPGQLSGGMQQRVNLARALAVSPDLLLLDEPFASVDAQTRAILQDELSRICVESGVTALFVTHDIDEAVFLGDRVGIFSPRPGQLLQTVTVPAPRPRPAGFRRTPEFVELASEISDVLHGQDSFAGRAAR